MQTLPQPLRAIIEVPATIVGLLAIAVFTIWAATEGGYPVADWLKGGIFLAALLGTALISLRGRTADLPGPVRVALVAFAAFTAWNYLSILWADQQGEAWDGANRTLLYLIIFALFAMWSQRGDGAATLVGAWTLAVVGIALWELLGLSRWADPSGEFIADRLAEPAGYPNAAACSMMMAFWPAIVLAARRELPFGVRGAFAAAAVILADVALLSLSRGSIFSIPIVLALFFAFVPGRVRHVAVLAAVAPAIAITVPSVLDVGHQLRDGKSAFDAVQGVAGPVIFAAIVTAVVVGAFAYLEGAREWTRETRRRVHRGIGGIAIAATVAGAVVGLAIAGNPVNRLDDAWHSFKRGYATQSSGSRLSSGLGSNRYDFYRVASRTFVHHPLIGVGSDNFGQEYLLHGHSDETPRYPHSLELRTLSQTGLIGTAMLLTAIAAMLLAAWRAMRTAEPLAAAAAGAAASGFVYWLVHGSFDWFWEFPGLAGPAFALAGIAAALVPRRYDRAPGEPQTERPVLRSRIATAATGIVVGAAAASFILPWLSDRDVTRAARTWSANPVAAFKRLDRAADLNPLSDRAPVIAGNIALRLHDLPLARFWFERGLARDSRNSYSRLELGAIAATQGRRADARRLLTAASALAPRDEVITATLRKVQRGQRVDIDSVNRDILERTNRLVR